MLLSLIRQATRAVPAVRYALGVVGVAAAAAIVIGVVGGDLRVAVFAPLGLLLLMVLLLLFAKLAGEKNIPTLRAALLVMIWMPLLLGFGALVLLAFSIFFGWPLDLRDLLPGRTTTTSPTPAPIIRREVQTLPEVIKANEYVTFRPAKGSKVTVKKPIRIEQDGTLEIVAGVTLQFGRDIGILCEGSLLANGTAEERITFTSADTRMPWRNVVVRSPLDRESSFAYCDFEGGTGAAYFEPNTLISDDESQFKAATGRPRIGGGLIVFGANSVRLERCRFIKCSATKAGALYVRSSRISLIGCEFSDNYATSNSERAAGGAIYSQNSDMELVDCEFVRNSASDKYSCGGAIYLGFRSRCVALRTLFRRNQATHAGGALYALNLPATRPHGRETALRSVEVIDGAFQGNTAGSGGGAIYIDQGFTCRPNGVHFTGNAIGPEELPLHAKAAPGTLLNGAAVMAKSDVTDNPTGLVIGENACTYSDNAVFVPESEIGDSTRLTAVFIGENVNAQPYEDQANVVIVRESRLPPTCYRKQRQERKIDTAVVHHISAVNWFADDFQHKLSESADAKPIAEKLELTKETLNDWKYDWRPCKLILQVYRASSHYLISRSGEIIRLAHERDVALHAGKSAMPAPDGRPNVDQFSVGIEVIGASGEDDEAIARGEIPAYLDAQYESLRKLLNVVFSRRSDSQDPLTWTVVGHHEIAMDEIRGVAAGKKDPGPVFAWNNIRDAEKRLRLGLPR